MSAQYPLPGLLADIADEFGVDVALRLAEALGGTYQRLHARARVDHPIAQATSIEVLEWLIARSASHERLVIPMAAAARRARRRECVARLASAGHTINEIAIALRIHVREVERIKAALLASASTGAQGRLFG